jgi:hypothetical protein
MALYNRAAEVFLSLKPKRAPGWTIYSDWTNGSDATGDGTEARPYKTIAVGAADLRDGRGDALVLLPGNYVEAPVVIDQKDDISIVGVGGARVCEAGGGRTLTNTHTAWATWGGQGFEVTCSAAHGLQIGDYIFIANTYAQSTNYVNGFHEVAGVPSPTNFRFYTNYSVDGGAWPIGLPGFGFGASVPVSLTFRGCHDLLIAGLVIDASNGIPPDKMPCLCVDAMNNVVTSSRGNNILITRNQIGTGCIGLTNFPNFTTRLAGSNIQIEENAFNIVSNSFIPFQTDELVGALYLSAGANVVVNRNLFTFLRLIGGSPPPPWEPWGVIQYTEPAPAIGHLFTSNTFDTAANITRNRLFHIWNDWQNVTPAMDRIFVRRNTYADVDTVTPQTVSQAWAVGSPLVDREPETLVDEAFLPTQTDVIWQAPREELASFPGTAGEVQALAVYGGELYFDSVGGAGGTVVGVNGTPDNPSNSEADLRDLSTATKITNIRVAGTLTLLQAWEQFFFKGREGSPDNIVDANGQSVDASRFESLTFTGSMTGEATWIECQMTNASGLNGIALTIYPQGTLTLLPGGTLVALAVGSPGAGCTFDMSSTTGTNLVLGSMIGIFTIENVVGISIIQMAGSGANLTLDSTVNGGNVVLLGDINLTDNSTSTLSFNDYRLQVKIPDQTWDEALADHLAGGSTGAKLADIEKIVDATYARKELDTSNPAQWQMVLYDNENKTVPVKTFNLKDRSGNAISATNNPLLLGDVIIADRDPV